MKKAITIFVLIFMFLIKANPVLADFCVAGSSGQLVSSLQSETSGCDTRCLILKKYLEQHNSPLADYAEDFIVNADEYNLDWRMVPAITGVESTFGKRMLPNTYNAYGWGGGTIYFESWEDSIEHVSKSLREKYYDNGTPNIASVARRYAPPSSTWEGKVKWFMDQIDPVPVEFTL